MTRPVHSHNLPRKSTNFFSGNKSDWACEFPNTPLPVTNEKSASTNLVYSLPLDYQDFSVKNSYQQMLDSLANDSALHKEISLGKRVGFYKIGQQLGSGSFSKVKIGIHCLTNEMVAMKIVDKMKMDQKAQKLLAREITTMELLHHPNIIRFFECLQTISRTYLVMEYAGGGELYTYVHDKGKLQEDECKSLFAQIVSAVFHMHSKDIVHRDIKAENVIISKPGWVKLTDFGFACKVIPNKFLSTFCGSPAYAAPELFNKKKYFGKSVDIWAIGILLYFMLAGNTPFRGETIVDLTDCVLRGIYSLPDYLSTPAQLAISRMLVANPRDRSTIEEVKKFYFLQDCKFTEPYLQTYKIFDENESLQNPISRQVWDTLHFYGISEAIMKSAVSTDAGSAVIGIYRMIFHQVQQNHEYEERKRVTYIFIYLNNCLQLQYNN